MFPGTAAPAAVEVPEPPKTRIAGYTDDNLRIDFEMDPRDISNPNERHIVAFFSNIGSADVTALNMQVAVQKNMKITLLPATAAVVPAGKPNAVKQEMRIMNPFEGTKPISMKIKVGYTCKGQNASAMKTVTFPSSA